MDQTQQRDHLEESTMLDGLRTEAEAEHAALQEAATYEHWQRQAAGAVVTALVPGWELLTVERSTWDLSSTVQVTPDQGRTVISVRIEVRSAG